MRRVINGFSLEGMAVLIHAERCVSIVSLIQHHTLWTTGLSTSEFCCLSAVAI